MRKQLPAFLALLFLLTACAGGRAGSPWDVAESASVPIPPALEIPAASPPVSVAATPVPSPDQYASPSAAVAPPPQAPAAPPPPVKIGILLPLSGQHAALGQAMLQAAQLALFDMGYQSFELIPRDDKGTAAGARTAAQSAIESGAQLMLGPVFTDAVRGAQDVVSHYPVKMIAFSTNWRLAGGSTYIMGFLPFDQVERIAGYAASRGVQRTGLLAPSDEYGDAVVSAYNAFAPRVGMAAASVMRYPSGQNDFSEIAARFGQAGPYDAVLIAAGGAQARTLATLLRAQGMSNIRLLGTGLWDDPALSADPALQGAWFSAPSPDLRRSFESRYRETYGQAAPRLSTLAYDATALAATLARNGYGRDGRPAFDHESITNPNGFAGIDGIFRFRADGLAERGLAIMEVRGGAVEIADPAPRTFQQAGAF